MKSKFNSKYNQSLKFLIRHKKMLHNQNKHINITSIKINSLTTNLRSTTFYFLKWINFLSTQYIVKTITNFFHLVSIKYAKIPYIFISINFTSSFKYPCTKPTTIECKGLINTWKFLDIPPCPFPPLLSNSRSSLISLSKHLRNQSH